MSATNRANVRGCVGGRNLGRFNWFEDRGPRANEVGIVAQSAGWRVYSTDERAYEQYEEVYGDEEEALADFLKKVRATNRYFARRAERLQGEVTP
ncbi:hypothetical protein QFZ69_001693 [Arthrobacter sp. V1I7]|nr:hypothetical protein [Arthrobacter sp. V1I7]MDQ0820814.1 hypothetical protein [Arthrobacter sp. V1I7]